MYLLHFYESKVIRYALIPVAYGADADHVDSQVRNKDSKYRLPSFDSETVQMTAAKSR